MIPTLVIQDDLIYQNNTNTHRYDFCYHYQEKRNVRLHWCCWDT